MNAFLRGATSCKYSKKGHRCCPVPIKNELMHRYIIILSILFVSISARAQINDMGTGAADTMTVQFMQSGNDSIPKLIPFLLPLDTFIPANRLMGYPPWSYAPLSRPTVFILPTFGFNGSVGFGMYSIQHPEKFFSTLEGFNGFNIPQLYIAQQMMLGNTLRLARNFYMMSGILYGAQLGVKFNLWGIGERSGFIYNPRPDISIVIWDQYYHAVNVYMPVFFPGARSGAAINLPATPEVFSVGVQANFTVGEFIIGVGTSVTPPKKEP